MPTLPSGMNDGPTGAPPRISVCNLFEDTEVPSRRLLNQLIRAARAKPKGRLEVPRRIKPGSELVRTWNGNTYRVMVTAEGFAWEGQTFASLSEVASRITGTKWNGPRFFGLRVPDPEGGADGR
jgi:Protein of unknown function (DUF2924)